MSEPHKKTPLEYHTRRYDMEDDREAKWAWAKVHAAVAR